MKKISKLQLKKNVVAQLSKTGLNNLNGGGPPNIQPQTGTPCGSDFAPCYPTYHCQTYNCTRACTDGCTAACADSVLGC